MQQHLYDNQRTMIYAAAQMHGECTQRRVEQKAHETLLACEALGNKHHASA